MNPFVNTSLSFNKLKIKNESYSKNELIVINNLFDRELKKMPLKINLNKKSNYSQKRRDSACLNEKLKKAGRITEDDFKIVKGRYNIKKL